MWLYLTKLSYYKECLLAYATNVFFASRGIYRLLTTQENGLEVCLQWMRQLFTNQIGKKFVEMHRHYYIIHYPYGITWYKIIVPRRIGPCLIDTITDHNEDNVKKDIFVYMGPSHNFHGSHVSPEMLGYTSLTFTFLDGSEKKFTGNEMIIL